MSDMAKWAIEKMISKDDIDAFMDEMLFNEYQVKACKTAIYPKQYKIIYPAMLLCGEAGEIANKVQKHMRDGTPLDDKDLAKELGDCLWALANLAEDLGYDFDEIATMNIEKLKSRARRGTLSGSGDHR